MTSRKLIIILSITIVVVIGLIFIFINPFTYNILALLDAKDVKDTIRFEIIKSLLQLLVIVIIGGIVTQLFKAAEFSKQQAQIFLTLRMDFLKRLGDIYSAVKSSRRELRADGLTTKFGGELNLNTAPKQKSYQKHMKSLNKLQLGLEELKRESQSSPALISYTSLVKELKRMEDYLKQVYNEFVPIQQRIEEEKTIELNELERLNEFTCSTKQPFSFKSATKKTDYRFKSHFSQSYKKIIGLFTE